MKELKELGKSISPFLRNSGFKKKEFRWNRNRENLVDVITLQNSPWNINNNVSFYINAGIFVSDLYTIVWDKPIPKIVSEVDCFVRFRLDDNGSESWNINKGESSSIKEELELAITTQAFSLFEKLQSLKDIYYYLTNKHGYQPSWLEKVYLAITAKKLGDQQKWDSIWAEFIGGDILEFAEKMKHRKNLIEKRLKNNNFIQNYSK